MPDDAPRSVTALLPSGFRDPSRPSGGNVYDAKLLAGLRREGWEITEALVPDPGVAPARDALGRLDATLGGMPDGTVVLADGLVATAAAPVVVPHSARLVMVVLLHLPRSVPLPAAGDESAAAAAVADSVADSERQVLAAAAGVITTSTWTASWIARQPGLSDVAVTVALPGVDPAPLAAGTPAESDRGPNLLFLGRIAPAKGIDVLVGALSRLGDIPWHCWCVGPADNPAFADGVRRAVDRANLSTRVHLTGALTGTALADRLDATDLLIAPSRFETYGMVITEALARGIPVVATDVGGIREALGCDLTGRRPGRLVAPDDAGGLAAAIRAWLTSARLRRLWCEAARRRRAELSGWDRTARIVAATLVSAR